MITYNLIFFLESVFSNVTYNKKCIEIAGVQGDSTNEARMAGYKAGVEAAGGDFLEDEVQYANAVADQAVTCMYSFICPLPCGDS